MHSCRVDAVRSGTSYLVAVAVIGRAATHQSCHPPNVLSNNGTLLCFISSYVTTLLHYIQPVNDTSSNSTSVSFFDEPAQLSSALNNIDLVTYTTFFFSLFLFRYHIIHLAVLTIDVASSHEHQKTRPGGCAIPCLPTILIPT